jgi:hypothetical protein
MGSTATTVGECRSMAVKGARRRRLCRRIRPARLSAADQRRYGPYGTSAGDGANAMVLPITDECTAIGSVPHDTRRSVERGRIVRTISEAGMTVAHGVCGICAFVDADDAVAALVSHPQHCGCSSRGPDGLGFAGD